VSTPSLWTVLGIRPTRDVTLIRRAYATLLKRIDAEEDPAGFATLRQAYEQAMTLARSTGAPAPAPALVAAAEESLPSRGPRESVQAAGDAAITDSVALRTQVDLPTSGPPSQPPDIAPATAGPTALDQLRAAFVALQKAATTSQTPNCDELRALLEACLTSPALENLTVQLEFEPAMVRFFAQTLPRTQSLLETVIAHWKWRDRPRSAAGGAIAALVGHADNLRAREQLQVSAPRVYRALTRPPRPALLWIQVVILGLDVSVRQALEQFRNVAPGTFDARAQQWWSDFFTRPHLRPLWIRAAGVLALLGVYIGGFIGMDGGRLWLDAALGGVSGALGGLAFAGLWLGLIDWPRHRLKATRSASPAWLRLGWAPAAGAACVLSTVCPDGLPALIGAVAVSLVLLSWVIIMAPGFRDATAPPVLTRIWAALIVNIPLGVWWTLAYVGPVAPPTVTMSVVFVATVLAVTIGQPLLWVEFIHDFSRSQQQQARAALAAIALGALALLLLTRIAAGGSHLLLICLVLIALAHRTPALNLTAGQVKLRHYMTVVPAAVLGRVLNRDDMATILQLGGLCFMAGVALSMGVCIYNDWKASREGDPEPASDA
jgi:hypothetical protein